jgi:hypothetical protein
MFARSIAAALVMRCPAAKRDYSSPPIPGSTKKGCTDQVSLHLSGEQFLLDALLDRGQHLLMHFVAFCRDQALVILQFP